jgi:hypothetical protein
MSKSSLTTQRPSSLAGPDAPAPGSSPVRTEAEWEAIIREDLNRAKEGAIQFLNGVISAGQNLTRAKQEVGHGRFGSLLARLNINERTAQRLMNIGAHPTITNSAYAGLLPISMRTLSELATIPPATLEGLHQRRGRARRH